MILPASKIGLFFGSFNPIHNGHTQLAEYILSHTDITEIWLVVSPCNPFKVHAELASEEQRLDMAELAIASMPAVKACDIEFNMPKPSYTVHTLQRISTLYPQNNFTLIIGEDNLRVFDRWKDAEKIADNYPLLVYPRQESGYTYPIPQFPDIHFANLQIVNAPLLPISSTEIRQMIAQKKDVSQWLHPDVERYIYTHGLYINN